MEKKKVTLNDIILGMFEIDKHPFDERCWCTMCLRVTKQHVKDYWRLMPEDQKSVRNMHNTEEF